jgi:hypothetical protein
MVGRENASRESNAFVRKNWTDKTTRLIPLNPSVGQCLVFGMEPPTRAAVLLSPLFQTGNEALRRAASFPLGYDVLGAQQSLGQERGMGGGRLCGALVVHDQPKQRSQGVELAPMPVTPHQTTTVA